MDIKIAFTFEKYPANGGTEKINSDLAAYLAANGFRVYMFVEKFDEKLLCESDRKNITFIPVTFADRKNKAANDRHIIDRINELGIEILLAPLGHKVDPSLVKQNSRCKIVYSLHFPPMYQMIEFHNSRGTQSVRSGSLGKILEWYLVRYPSELLTGSRSRKTVRKYVADYRNCDLYTVLCDQYKQDLLEIMGPGIADNGNNHIEALLNFIPPRDYGDPVKKKRVLYVGRLEFSQKRVDLLLDIWEMVYRDFPDWELYIVGSGSERERLIRRSEKLGLRNVEFHDFTVDPGEYYRDASIFCLTSIHEGWGLVISEAQQAGAVPISFVVGAGVKLQISPNGVNGILVEPFDTRAYARELAALMRDDGRRERMSRNVMAKAREYSDARLMEKWAETLRRLSQ